MADKEYLEGNIDKEEYENMKSMSVEKVIPVSSERVSFATPINYKQNIYTINRRYKYFLLVYYIKWCILTITNK